MLLIAELKNTFPHFPTLDPQVLKVIQITPESERNPWQVFLYPIIPINLDMLFPFEYPDFYQLLVEHASSPQVDESFLLQAAQYWIDYLIEQLSSEQISLNDIGDIMLKNFSIQLIAAVYNQLLMKRLDGFDTIDIAAYVYAYVLHQFYEKEEGVLLSEILDRIFSKTELSEVDSERFQQSVVLRWLLVTDLFKQPDFLQPMLDLLLNKWEWEQPISSDILNRKNKRGETLLMRLCEIRPETEIVKVMVQTLLRRDDIEFIDVLFSEYDYELISYLPGSKTDNLISLFGKSWLSVENGSPGLPELSEDQRWLCELCYTYGLEETYTVKNQALHRFISSIIEQFDYSHLYGLDLQRLHELEEALNKSVGKEAELPFLVAETLNRAYEIYGISQYIEKFTQLLAQLEKQYFQHVQKQQLQTSLIKAGSKGKFKSVEAFLITARALGIMIDPSLLSATANFSTPIILNERPGMVSWPMLSVISEESILQEEVDNKSDSNAESVQVDPSNRSTFSNRKRSEIFFSAFFSNAKDSSQDKKITETCSESEGNHDGDNVEALVRACFLGRIDVVDIVLQRGVDVNKRNSEENTALMIACEYSLTSESHVHVVNLLLRQDDIRITKDIFKPKYFYKFVFCLSDLKLASFMALKKKFPKNFQQGIDGKFLPRGYAKHLQPYIEICHAYLEVANNEKRNLALNRYFLRAMNPQCNDLERYFLDFQQLIRVEKSFRDMVEISAELSIIVEGYENLLNSAFEIFLSSKHATVFKEILKQLKFIEQHMFKSPLFIQARKAMLDNLRNGAKCAMKVGRSSDVHEKTETLNVPQALFSGIVSGPPLIGAYAESPFNMQNV